MRPIVSAVTAVLLFAGTGFVAAQTVVIQPEQETVVREYIKKKPVASITLPGVELNIGSTLDEKVELHTMDVPDMKYRYVVVDNRTYLVEPETRKIVHIIQ